MLRFTVTKIRYYIIIYCPLLVFKKYNDFNLMKGLEKLQVILLSYYYSKELFPAH